MQSDWALLIARSTASIRYATGIDACGLGPTDDRAGSPYPAWDITVQTIVVAAVNRQRL